MGEVWKRRRTKPYEVLVGRDFLPCIGDESSLWSAERLPFEVSNPAQKKWAPAEAERIYSWACALLAKTVRPENPPRLHPRFRLVLGAEDNVFVRDHGVDEIRLKAWDATKFAEGVVAIAVRDVVQSNEQALLARRSVMLAHSTIDAHEKR